MTWAARLRDSRKAGEATTPRAIEALKSAKVHHRIDLDAEQAHAVAASILPLSQDEAAALTSEGMVLVPDIPWPLLSDLNATPAGLNPASLWHHACAAQLPPASGEPVRVAVFDSGVDAGHVELSSSLDGAYELTQTGEIATAAGDWNGHGTHVCGLIAGANVGLAPAARLDSYLTVHQHGQQASPLPGIIATVERLLRSQKVPDVLNLSLGWPLAEVAPAQAEALGAVFATLAALNVVVVAAIGNEGKNALRLPAALRTHVLSVGAHDVSGEMYAGSSWGRITDPNGQSFEFPHLVAPGVNVTSSWPEGQYAPLTGTSQATAVVSGVIARRWGALPNATALDVVADVLNRCRPLQPPTLAEQQGRGTLFS
jgi:subtilisin family serine protease